MYLLYIIIDIDINTMYNSICEMAVKATITQTAIYKYI